MSYRRWGLFVWEIKAQICKKMIEMNESKLKFYFGFGIVYPDFVVTNVLGNEWKNTQTIMFEKLGALLRTKL